jgi:hypothetical protein
VTGGWRKLHNEELHNLYSSPSIIRMIKSRRMRYAGHAYAYRILVRKPGGKRPLGRPRRRWVNNIKMDLKKIKKIHSARRPLIGLLYLPRLIMMTENLVE